MAIQIDLLPQYVGLRRKVKAAAIFMFIVYVIAGTAFTLVWYQKTLEVQTAKTNADLYRAVAAEATKVDGEAKAKVASLAPKQSTIDFFVAASQTGPRRAAVIDMLKMYINADSLVSAIDISDGKTVLITASIKNTDDYGNLLLNLRKGFITHDPQPATPTLFDSNPAGSGLKGYPLPEPPLPPIIRFGELVQQTFPLDVNIKTTLKPDLVFETPLALGEAAAAAVPGQPGAAPAGSSSSTPTL